jgi:uncharacterized protein YecE (DUF72 family)
VTSPIAYVRLHGRNPHDWAQEFGQSEKPLARHDYLYKTVELIEWRDRIERMRQFSASTFVFTNNDIGGKAVVNGIQLAELLGDDRHNAPSDLAREYPIELAGLATDRPTQPYLFAA